MNAAARHLVSIRSLSEGEATALLTQAETFYALNRQAVRKSDVLKGRTVINLFFENSTRTRTSFELAGKRLGADVINISADSSSVKKGETLKDTALTLDAMHCDVLVVRHPHSGAPAMLRQWVRGGIVNAGDGCHEHPSQALLDAFTLQHRLGNLRGKTIAICGDILHSRVARSNVLLLKLLGANVRLVAPATLLPLDAQTLGAEVASSLRSGLEGADAVMVLRLQRERMQGSFVPSVREYFATFGLNRERLAYAKPGAVVLHPGPMNRGVEIESGLADDIECSAILDQVEAGVAVRQAILTFLVTGTHNEQ